MKAPRVTHEAILECLRRSGYCMEGRLVKILNDAGYFVETSQPLQDKLTGKSREIDLVAEQWDVRSTRPRHENTCVKTSLVIEAVNNLMPIVLLTPVPWSPMQGQESYVPHCCTPPDNFDPHPFFVSEHHADLYAIPDSEIYAQYCAIAEKKSKELMASHSDDLHSSLQKAVEYSLELRRHCAEWMSKEPEKENRANGYWRIFNWQPVIVVQDQLLTLSDPEGNKLKSVEQAYYAYNFHHDEVPVTVAVSIVTEAGLKNWAAKLCERDYAYEAAVHSHRATFGEE